MLSFKKERRWQNECVLHLSVLVHGNMKVGLGGENLVCSE